MRQLRYVFLCDTRPCLGRDSAVQALVRNDHALLCIAAFVRKLDRRIHCSSSQNLYMWDLEDLTCTRSFCAHEEVIKTLAVDWKGMQDVTLSELVRKGIEHIDQPRFSTWLNLQRAGKPLFGLLSAYQLDLMQSLERTWLSANPTPKQHEEKLSHMEDRVIWTHLVKFMETQLQQNPEVDTLLLHEPTHFALATKFLSQGLA